LNLLPKKEARARLKNHLPFLERREEFETRILGRLYRLLKNHSTIISYVADPALEVDVLPLIESCPLPRPSQFWEFRHFAKWYFPKITESNVLIFVRPMSWQKGKFGLWEPVGEEIITPEQADLILVPALGYAKDGSRLGRGGGYYDKVLSDVGLKNKTIGLTFSKFFPVPFSSEDHDCRVGKIVTEDVIHSFLD